MVRLLLCLLLCLIVAPAPLPSQRSAPPASHHDGGPPAAADDNSTLLDNDAMRLLAEKKPIRFLQTCLRRHIREVKGYHALLAKHERLAGNLLGPEVIRVSFREKPHSVLMQWLEGARLAGAVLYVQGENNNLALVRPAGLASLIGIVERNPVSEEALQNSRYTLPDFGIRIGAERTLAAWVDAEKRGQLQVEYRGIRPIPELNNRLCHVLHRTSDPRLDDEGVAHLTIYIDQENWMQIGSVLRGAKGELIAEYYFRDLQLNPTFPANFFTRDAMP
jgi:Protein of unknown function (DUF1571)